MSHGHIPQDPEDEKIIEELMKKMTVEEKVGQLELLSRPWGDDFNGESAQWQDTINRTRAGRLGALFNGQGVEVNRALQRVAVEESRLGIPLIFGADVWHGMWTIFPVPLGEAASWEPSLAYETARATAVETTLSGLMWTFSPMVDTARDQRWGRNVEGAGEDPFLGEAFASARVRGFQGPDLKAEDSLASCLKHFAGYGGVLGGRDYSESDISEATFRDVFLPPFIAGIRAGAVSIMSAFQALEGVPATGNHWLLTEVLRNELGFEGFVVTDYNADGELVNHGFAANGSDAARLALSAGVDMSMHSEVFRNLPELLGNGSISQSRLDDAVRNVLRAKAAMGLFANPYKTLDPSKEWTKGHYAELQEEHDKLARRAGRRSLVLLKNDNNTLPLRKYQRIAVIGWWSNSTDTDGVGVIWGNRSNTVTLLHGLQAVVDSNHLRFVQGSEVEKPIDGGIDKAVSAAQWADVVLLTLGESYQMIGEAKSVTQLRLPEAQQNLAEAVAKVGRPVVVLLKNGRALELEGSVKRAEALVVTWFLGKMTGHSIADVLFGVSPSGRLPITFPMKSGQQPLYYNHMSSGRPCVWGWGWRSCYRDASDQGLYPFGHGLTYSSIEYGIPMLSSASIPWEGVLVVSCNVSNTGPRAAREVVQLYVHDQVASRVRPLRELKGFRKILLRPNQTRTVIFELSREKLSFTAPAHSHRHGAIVEPGKFLLWVAPSSSAGNPVSFELEAPPLI